MVGMEAREDSEEVARLVNISRDKDGWFIESHPKLDPGATTTDGVFIAGACAAPKDIPDSVAQARAAAARILARTAHGKIDIDAVFAEVDEEKCAGCRMCNELCPYAAIEFDPEKRRSRVISALCKSCGACVAACPSGAITAHHFTDAQIFSEIEGCWHDVRAKIVGFLSNWCSYTGADCPAPAGSTTHPSALHQVDVTARIDPTFELKALHDGADGVLIRLPPRRLSLLKATSR
jgi:heterodisulfide reductase subunit A